MSATKRYLEDITVTITTAIEVENTNHYQYLPFEYGEADTLEEAVFAALCDAQYNLIFIHLDSCWTECAAGFELEQKPLTFRALTTLLPFVSDELLEDCGYTRSPLSLVNWNWVEEARCGQIAR